MEEKERDEFVIGRDRFTHNFVIKRRSNYWIAVKNFSRFFGSFFGLVGCMLVFSAVGSFIHGRVTDTNAFFQSFYLHFFMFTLFLLGLIFIMRKRLQNVSLPTGDYQMECDDTQLVLSSAKLGLQRYALSAVEFVRQTEEGSEIILNSGFTLAVPGVDLSIGNPDPLSDASALDTKSIWFAQDN